MRAAISNSSAATPGALPERESALRQRFLDQVDRIPGGEKLRRCIQCGTCTGSCPVSFAMDLSPRAVIARFRAGDIESILRSRTIWLCASCYMCTTRCPQGIKITDLLYALKRMGIENQIHPARFPVYVLSESFVKNVNRYGRNWEAGLMERYWRRATGPVVGLVNMARHFPMFLQLWRRGRVNVLPRRIQAIGKLKSIVARAEQMERPVEREELKPVTRKVGYQAIGG